MLRKSYLKIMKGLIYSLSKGISQGADAVVN